VTGENFAHDSADGLNSLARLPGDAYGHVNSHEYPPIDSNRLT